MACGLQSRAYLAINSEMASAECPATSDFVHLSAVITGNFLGSWFAITMSPLARMLKFPDPGDEYTRHSYEFRGLATVLTIFPSMTNISRPSFYCVVGRHRLSRSTLNLTWPGLVLTNWNHRQLRVRIPVRWSDN